MHGFGNKSEFGRTDSAHQESQQFLVWDLPTRLFHWLLVITVTVAAGTGFLAPESWLGVHYWAGSLIALLVVFRVAWGFWGSGFSRFRSFVFPLHETVNHLRSVLRFKTGQYIGHNPAGALMVFGLLIVLSVLSATGLIVLGGQENIGIFAGFVSFETGAMVADIHEVFAYSLLAMIGAHLLGVLGESIISKQKLVRAMITGRKILSTHGLHASVSHKATLWRAVGIVALILLVSGSASYGLLSVAPSGYIKLAKNASYVSECGDCHHAYHPSLLPAASWQTMMANLENHFGEDASLDEITARDLSKYLQNYASEHWDSEAANNLRSVSLKDPLRITASPYWRRRHKGIPKSTFMRFTVKSKGNCIACHGDASSGRFDDENIAIPEPVVTTPARKMSFNQNKELK